MNVISRIFLLLGMGLFLCSTALSQDSQPKAVVVDECDTRGNNCEETFARLDSFYTELSNNPSDQGYIVIYQVPESRSAGPRRERQLVNHIRMRRFDRSRVVLVSGTVRKDAKVHFWRVPAGAENPEIMNSDADYEQPEPPEGP